jgi:hypothetical protein
MTTEQTYCVALFDSVSHVMKAEKILKAAGVQHKIIPVPRSISADCGVCLRFLPEHTQIVIDALGSQVTITEIREIRREGPQ